MSTAPAPTLDQLRAVTTVSVRDAGAWLGMSTASAYRAAADGTMPTIRVGKTLRVPTPKLLALVGLSYEVGSADDAASDHPEEADCAGV